VRIPIASLLGLLWVVIVLSVNLAYVLPWLVPSLGFGPRGLVIDTGPYRLIRHPSYSGALMAFLGLGLCIGNWASLATMLIPTLLVFSWRIRVGEQALLGALGEPYLTYTQRTKRLVPVIY